jgi:hypothetical protein
MRVAPVTVSDERRLQTSQPVVGGGRAGLGIAAAIHEPEPTYYSWPRFCRRRANSFLVRPNTELAIDTRKRQVTKIDIILNAPLPVNE